ncbi:MAG TPA: ester cyclase, partial [Herpetosiphonaceae bacterium]
MSTQENKAIVQQFLEEIFNQKNFAALDALVDPDVATHYNQSSHAFQVLTAFPDFHIIVEDMMTEGDVVVCRSTWRATHQGEYMSIPPTGKVISGRRTDIFRVGGGKIVESRQKWDSVHLMQQLGSDTSANQHVAAGQEPLLEIAEIQGNILPGFHTRYQTLVFLEIVDLRRARAWLCQIQSRVTTAADLLPFQRQVSSGKIDISSAIWLNIAFSFGGLHKLIDTAEQFTDPAFKEGMPDRSVLLGDSTRIDAESHPSNWLLGGPGQIPDMCLIVGGNDCDRLGREVAQIEAAVADSCVLLFKETGAALAPPLHDYEHFGFRDHISQPGVRGRLSERPDDFLTPRQNPANPNQGKPGQPVLWPGEFVFGYPGQDPLDKFRPGPSAEAGPAWARNGSFLVVRRLRQDVSAFRAFLLTAASELSQQYPALAGLTPELLAAKLMGRWFSGAPILRAPNADDPALGQDPDANNAFSYVRAPASTSPEQQSNA